MIFEKQIEKGMLKLLETNIGKIFFKNFDSKRPLIQLKMIELDPLLIKKIQEPCKEVQQIIFKKYPNLISELNKNKNKPFIVDNILTIKEIIENKDLLISKNIKFILNNEEQNLLLKESSGNVKLIENVSIESQKYIIQNNPEQIYLFEKNLDLNVAKEEIRNNPSLVKYFKLQNQNLQITAVESNPTSYLLIKNPTDLIKNNIMTIIESYNKRNENQVIYDVVSKSIIESSEIGFDVTNKNEVESLVKICEKYGYENIKEELSSSKEYNKILEQTLYKETYNKEFLLELVKQNGLLLKNINNESKMDIEICFEAIKNNSIAYNYIPNNIKEIYGRDIDTFYSNVDMELKKGRDIKYSNLNEMLNSNLDGLEIMKYSSDSLRNNSELVKKCIESNYKSYEFISETQKRDEKIIGKVLQKEGDMLRFIPYDLRNRRDICLSAIKENHTSFEYSEELKSKFKNVEKFKLDEISFERLDELSKRGKSLLKECNLTKEDVILPNLNSKYKTVDTSKDNNVNEKKEVKTSIHKQK
jgi:hypothetical protein